MIGSAMQIVCNRLNTIFSQHNHERVVSLCPAQAHGATGPGDSQNRILCSVTNVLQESALRNQLGTGSPNPARASISINLQVIFAANFDDYATALDYLADVIMYLQGTPVFDRQNTANLPASVQRLAFSMLNLEYAELSHLWGMLRTEYRPCAVYDVRMLRLQDTTGLHSTHVSASGGAVRDPERPSSRPSSPHLLTP